MSHNRRGRWTRDRRGLSEIIGELLILGFTVVLAAVLLVTVWGFVHQPSPPPLGTQLAIVSPTESQGGPAGPFYYNLTPAYAGSRLILHDLAFRLLDPGGRPVPTATISLTVFGPTDRPIATYDFVNASWHASDPRSDDPGAIHLTSADLISIASETDLSGGRLVISGQHGLSGSTAVGIP